MFHRRRNVQNEVIGQRMRRFFRRLSAKDRADPKRVAACYGEYFWSRRHNTLVEEKRLSQSRFHVGLSASSGNGIGLAELTKCVTLVTDTLLLSHDWTGRYHELGEQAWAGTKRVYVATGGLKSVEDSFMDGYRQTLEDRRNRITTMIGMHCPDLNSLGEWILDAEPLLTAGLCWYLPSYAYTKYETVDGVRHEQKSCDQTAQLKAIDYLIKNGRAVDASGTEPIKNKLVRPVLHTELPFIQGVGLRDFSRITIEEFDSYTAFRDFLRRSLLDLDKSLNDVHSEQAIGKLGFEINEEIRAMRANMTTAHRKRTLAASGALLGSVETILVAVYGPALASAIAAIGANGGVWGVINAMAKHNPRALREDKWYYVWALPNSGSRSIRKR